MGEFEKLADVAIFESVDILLAVNVNTQEMYYSIRSKYFRKVQWYTLGMITHLEDLPKLAYTSRDEHIELRMLAPMRS